MPRKKIANTTIVVFLLLGAVSGVYYGSLSIHDADATSSNTTRTRVTSPDLIPHPPFIIDDDADFLNPPVSGGSGSISSPFIIENLEISFSATSPNEAGITVTDTTKHFIIRNCKIVAEGATRGMGILIDDVVAGTANITNNTIDGASYGIALSFAPLSTISNNEIASADVGTAGISLVASDACFISENYLIATGIGIYLEYSVAAEILENTVINNTDYGMFLIASALVKIKGNEVITNAYGIYLLNTTSNSSIECNLLQDNFKYGVHIGWVSDNNRIHHNNFVRNNPGNSQAFDASTYNAWYDPVNLEGNYWSDWIGSGGYAIAGGASVDPHPLPNPVDVEECLLSETPSSCPEEDSPGFLGVLALTSFLFFSGVTWKKRKRLRINQL